MAQGQQRGQRQPLPIGSRRGQDGSRWYNERPTGRVVANWFKEDVPLDSGMTASRYVGGITLIEGWENAEEIRDGQQQGTKIAVKVRNRVFTPYMRVDTRILYFWEWCDERGVIGAINPAAFEEGQRPGFFLTTVGHVEYVGCSMQVVVRERLTRSDGAEMIVRQPPPATKLVPLYERKWDNQKNAWGSAPDPYAHMKAETGAIGRALGFAGMLVVPGTGVATAEDIQEMVERQAAGGALTDEDRAAAPTLPDPAPAPEDAPGEPAQAESGDDPDAELRQEARDKLELLKGLDETRHAEFQRWARDDRKFSSFDDITPAQLRGVVRKLDKEIAQASTPDEQAA